MVDRKNLSAQAVAAMVEKAAHAECGNGVAKFFFGRVGLEFIDVVLAEDIKILAFV